MADDQYDFDKSFQEKVVGLVMRDSGFATRTLDLIKPEYFTEEAVSSVINVLQNHVRTYKTIPDLKIIPVLIKDELASRRIRADIKDDVVAVVRTAIGEDLSNPQFVLDKVTDFAKSQAIMNGMEIALAALDKGDYATIEKVMKAALSIGNSPMSVDYDYWAENQNRAQYRKDVAAGKITKRGISTGYAGMDQYLYHNGWGRKELSVIMGAAKAGKSMALGDFAKNASLLGYNVFYGSLEVSHRIISDRLDAALSDTVVNQLHIDPDDVAAKIDAMTAKSGQLRMRDWPSGTLKVTQLHRTLEDYKADGIIFDLIAVDYADIMAAEYRSDKLADNLREIYIDLRALGQEFDAALLTATQTNRNGAQAATAKATDVGDDWNKIRTADIVIGINATDAEKAAGEARLFWAVSRNTEDGFTLRIKQDRAKMKFLQKIMGRE